MTRRYQTTQCSSPPMDVERGGGDHTGERGSKPDRVRTSFSPNDDDGPVRRCDECQRELPATSRATRRFCSTACRVRHWHAANPPSVALDLHVAIRLHWHLTDCGSTMLYRNASAGHWYGPEGCPPECDGPTPPYTTSVPCQRGREGTAPSRIRPLRPI